MNEDFLKNLSKEKALKVKGSLKFRLMSWFLISLSYVIFIIAIVGIRKDFLSSSTHYQFWLDVLLLFLMAFSSALVCFKLSIPGQEREVRLRSLYLPISLWILANIITYFIHKATYEKLMHGIFAMCFYEILIISILPAFVLFKMSRLTDIRYPRFIGLSSFLAASSICALAVQFSCPNSNPLHTLVSHILPVVCFSLIGYFLIRKIFKA